MTENQSAEPNLDEILASIRRIISEDGPAAAASPALYAGRRFPLAEAEDVLVLTRRAPLEGHDLDAGVADDHPQGPPEPATPVVEQAPDPAMDPSLAPVLEAAPAADADEVETAAGAAAVAEVSPSSDEEEEVVVAPQTEAQAAAAFDKLSAAAHAPSPSAALALPAPGRTLEDVVRELMRPMIKEWLDENLPAIVQSRVDQEIDRIARSRVR
jgi:cell pole-organizing protein PopZ